VKLAIAEPADGAAVLWRFMDFTKYVSMLHRGALFFSRADQMPDPFEGHRPRRSYSSHRGARERERLRQQVFLSCWHQNDHESAAMWRIYLSSEHGVAIRTRTSRLESSLSTGEGELFIGTVRYLDYDREHLPRAHELEPFFCKRKQYDYEREVRVLWLNDAASDPTGLYLPVDLEQLIEEVIISPVAEEWFDELVRSVTEKYGLKLSIADSSLVGAGAEL
jgi:hypothetical protein